MAAPTDLSQIVAYDRVSLYASAFSQTSVDIITAASKTLDATDVGQLQLVTASTCTITLPATAASLFYRISAGDFDQTINISPNAADKLMGGGLGAGVDDTDIILTDSRPGDYIELLADASNGYYIIGMSGKWASA